MANINSNQTVNLYTTVTGGLQPYDQCARWSGSYTASNGNTGPIVVSTAPFAPPNAPFIESNNTPCSIPGTDGGSLTGTLVANGFTGSISVWVDVADSSGIFKESNTKSYTVLPVTALIVNAGPDYALSGAGPHNFSVGGATASGGSPPYTYLWTQSWPGTNPERSFFTPGTFPFATSTALLPDLKEFNSNGTYNFQLTATDNSGQTGTDSMQVTVTGATPPPLGPSDASIIWETTSFDPGNVDLNFVIRKNGGNQATAFNTDSGSLGGWVAGDIISGSTSCVDADGNMSVSAYWEISKQSRTAPYPITFIASYIECDNGSASVTATPGVTYDPAFQYRIRGTSGYC
jgi:hypothetical protein